MNDLLQSEDLANYQLFTFDGNIFLNCDIFSPTEIIPLWDSFFQILPIFILFDLMSLQGFPLMFQIYFELTQMVHFPEMVEFGRYSYVLPDEIYLWFAFTSLLVVEVYFVVL